MQNEEKKVAMLQKSCGENSQNKMFKLHFKFRVWTLIPWAVNEWSVVVQQLQLIQNNRRQIKWHAWLI